ncbi:uncharacterized protein ARMOST_14400 [Armillaria ostoyae]|uniref:Uncharacterized protein n=1 Tax=Armillaria ostoyae TaxID=47428 RepID=A0A284RQH4_ARMOS|nr:uncharacterized protein ARMOST_14400 [Armillaria ostoyae]
MWPRPLEIVAVFLATKLDDNHFILTRKSIKLYWKIDDLSLQSVIRPSILKRATNYAPYHYQFRAGIEFIRSVLTIVLRDVCGPLVASCRIKLIKLNSSLNLLSFQNRRQTR